MLDLLQFADFKQLTQSALASSQFMQDYIALFKKTNRLQRNLWVIAWNRVPMQVLKWVYLDSFENKPYSHRQTKSSTLKEYASSFAIAAVTSPFPICRPQIQIKLNNRANKVVSNIADLTLALPTLLKSLTQHYYSNISNDIHSHVGLHADGHKWLKCLHYG
jgi:hypothetical protein